MTWEEAVAFCENHECEECPQFGRDDCRTKYQKVVSHYPCCINLVREDLRERVVTEISADEEEFIDDQLEWRRLYEEINKSYRQKGV